MKSVSSTSTLPAIQSTALAKALRDPKVEGLARSLNLNLRDPDTLNNLLARAKQTIESSTRVSLGSSLVTPEEAATMDLVQIQNRYVRNALMTYQSIDAMR